MRQSQHYWEQYTTAKPEFFSGLVGTGSEDLWLEFKISKPAPDKNDKQNIAKALSSLANADGGVIVWGVHCKKGSDRSDVVQSIPGISEPEEFRRQLLDLEGKLVRPPIQGVEHKIVKGPDEKWLIVTHVPFSSVLHMACAEDQHCYYLKTGSATHKMEFYEIAARYALRPNPKLCAEVRVEKASSLSRGRVSEQEFSCVLAVKNTGLGAAHRPALAIELKVGPALSWEKLEHLDIKQYSDASHRGNPLKRIYQAQSLSVFPGSTRDYAKFNWFFKQGDILRGFRVFASIYYEGPPVEFWFDVTASALQSLIAGDSEVNPIVQYE